MSKTPSKRSRSSSQATPPTPEPCEGVSEIVELIRATQERIRRQVEADPLVRSQLYEDNGGPADGLTRDIVKDLREFLNIPKPARAKGKKPRKGGKQ